MDENGCFSCHTTDGSELAGPSFKNLIGQKVKVISEGKEIEVYVDEDYIRESILYPEKS
ncbi:MAG: hypothetical protein ABDH49_08315 [Candidatus Hydrothermales bacterium]